MQEVKRLLLENKAWVFEKTQVNPDYFQDMSKGQSPKFLWIGCSDSRVPPNEITGTNPGEMFVTRNIANLVVENDLSILSVVEYAIMYLKVRHIIVCGHYGCGGVIASLAPQSFGIIDGWIKNIKNVAEANWTQLKEMDEKTRIANLIELNTIQQAKNLVKTDTIQRAWSQGQEVYIHGWVFDLASGKLKDLITINKDSKL